MKIFIDVELTIHIITNNNIRILIVSVVEEPEFTDVIQNVTVPAGRSVRLACSVKNLGSYKVYLLL